MRVIDARFVALTVSLAVLASCSTVKDYFPDKEKDYQFSTQIPPLKVPDDILKSSLEKPAARPQLADDTEKVAVMTEMVKTSASKTNTDAAPPVVVEDNKQTEPTQVELVKFNNGAVRLRFNKPLATSVRLVSKALTRNTLEITRRDQANGEFTVQYDPNETDFQDNGFLDELAFVFEKDHSQEKPYHLKLVEQNRVTEMAVLDEQGQVLADGNGLSLLKLLVKTLKTELAKEISPAPL